MLLIQFSTKYKYFRERLGISKSIDADEKTLKLMEERKEEIKREFESDLARNVESFWAEKDSGFFGV